MSLQVVSKPHAAQRVAAAGPPAAAAPHRPTRMCFTPPLPTPHRFRRTWSQISIRPKCNIPQLNGSGSITKAAVYRFECNSISQSAPIWFWVIWQLWTAVKQNYSEELITLCPWHAKLSARQHAPVEHKHHPGRRRGVSLKCVWLRGAHSSKPTPQPGCQGRRLRQGELHRDSWASFLSLSGFLRVSVIHSSASLLSCFCVCSQSDQCRSALVCVVQVLAEMSFSRPGIGLLLFLLQPRSLFLRPQTGRRFFLHSSSEMSNLLFELRTMTELTKHKWSEPATHASQIASRAIFFLVVLSFSAIHQVQTASTMWGLQWSQHAACFFFFYRKWDFLPPTETLNKVIFVITKPPPAQITVSLTPFQSGHWIPELLSVSDSISKSAASNWKVPGSFPITIPPPVSSG